MVMASHCPGRGFGRAGGVGGVFGGEIGGFAGLGGGVFVWFGEWRCWKVEGLEVELVGSGF